MTTLPSLPALDRTVTHRLHSLQKLTDRLSQAAYLAEVGLPIGEARCLAAVGAFAPLSIKDTARRANLDKSRASRSVQTLVDKGLVRKAASPHDGRGVVLTLTAAGRRAWRRTMALIAERNEAILDCLGASERRQFDAMLDRLLAHAEAAAGTADGDDGDDGG